jgi:hypothetical protein
MGAAGFHELFQAMEQLELTDDNITCLHDLLASLEDPGRCLALKFPVQGNSPLFPATLPISFSLAHLHECLPRRVDTAGAGPDTRFPHKVAQA